MYDRLGRFDAIITAVCVIHTYKVAPFEELASLARKLAREIECSGMSDHSFGILRDRFQKRTRYLNRKGRVQNELNKIKMNVGDLRSFADAIEKAKEVLSR